MGNDNTMTVDPSHTIQFDLARLPEGGVPRAVTATPAKQAGRDCLRVQLTDAAANGKPGVDYVDMPTFLILPTTFRNGTIEVDILARLAPNAPEIARAFAGIAYRIAGDCSHFEVVYLRMLNGLKAAPPPPRDKRAIQYFAYPDWKFDRLRDVHPDGAYEAGANIGPDEWNRLKLDVNDTRVVASVNGVEVLHITEPKAEPTTGRIGLFVDIGTEAYFSNLVVTSG